MLKERSDHEHAPIISPRMDSRLILPVKSKKDLNFEEGTDRNLLQLQGKEALKKNRHSDSEQCP